MSDYGTRRAAAEEASLQRFEAVLQAGADAGLWSVVPTPPQRDPATAHWQRHHREVTTDAGRFALSCGNAAVEARVASVGSDTGIRANLLDLYPDPVAPTASAALTRDPLTVARDLHRRVCVPGADDARRLVAMLAEREAQRADLLAQVERMRAAGAEFTQHKPLGRAAYYEATMYVQGIGNVRVTATGKVYVERSVTVGVGDFATLRALIGRAE